MSRLLQQFYAFFDSREAWGGTGVPPGRSATKTKLARIRGLGRKFTLRLTGDGISHFGISCRSFGDAARCRSSAFGKGKGGGRNRDGDRDRDDREGREYRQRKLQYSSLCHCITTATLLGPPCCAQPLRTSGSTNALTPGALVAFDATTRAASSRAAVETMHL